MNKPKASPRRAVGLRRIAEDLGISVSLASKVLSGKLGTTGAQESTIRAIHEKARELNYRKNQLAAAFRTGRQHVIAVCVHRHGAEGSEIVEEMVAGIAAEAAEFHQRLMILYYQTPEEFHAFVPEVHCNAVDGVIMGGLPHTELLGDLTEMRERGLPVVTIHDRQIDPDFPNMGMNQIDVGRLATRHLFDRGCRRIVHLRMPRGMPGSAPVLRFEGYCQALREVGLPYEPTLVADLRHLNYDEGRKGIQALLDSGVAFDGIVGLSDQHAAAALNLLMENGRKVPQEVKLIGIDNAPFCRYTIIPLSSVSQEFVLRGHQAMRMLMSGLQGEPTASINVEPVIHARKSSAGIP